MTPADVYHGKAATRGASPGRGNDADKLLDQKNDDDDDDDDDDGKPRNLVIVFRCKPGDQTPADSKLIVSFFQKMKELSDTDDNIALLPGLLSAWKPNNNKGEVLSFTTHDLIIKFDITSNLDCFSHQANLKQECIAKAK